MPGPELERSAAALVEEICRCAGSEPARWLESELDETRRRFERARFLRSLAGARRRLRGAIGADPELVARARAALLQAALDGLPASAHLELVRELYRRGDSEERVAVLRSLPLLPDPARFVAIGVEACRSHVQVVFEAIACENPYAAKHFPDEAFRQLVLKALFTAVALARIEGLEARRTPELARMAAAYASELRAAGRAVSSDVERLASGARAAET